MNDTGDAFRAETWDEFFGQPQVKSRLSLGIEAANKKNRLLDHVLLDAPAGYGKTTLARIIADQTGHEFSEFTMPIKPKVLARFLQDWDGGVLFLDEIHRGSKREQEDLLTVLLDGYLQLDNGRRIYVSDTCVIGATTERSKVIPPLRERFPLRTDSGLQFVDYTDPEMGLIVASMASKVNVTFDASEAEALGRAAGGVPRIAGALVMCARDLFDTDQKVTVEEILRRTQMDPDGLTIEHMDYLRVVHKLGGAAVGLPSIITVLHSDESSVRGLERLLLKKDLIRIEPTGRELTGRGSAKMKPKKGKAA